MSFHKVHKSVLLRAWAYACVLLSLVWVGGCVDAQHKEYEFVAEMSEAEMAKLSELTRDGLGRLGKDVFEVESVEMISGIKMKVVDGFLYERDLEIVELWANLSFIDSYTVQTTASVKASVGKKGWTMSGARRADELGSLLIKDWSGRDKDRGSAAGKALGNAVADLFGELGQDSTKGTVKSQTDSERGWRVIVRLNFRGRDALLFDVAPRIEESDKGWLASSDLIAFLWNKERSRFSTETDGFDPAQQKVLEQAKANFEKAIKDLSEGSAGAVYHEARLSYEDKIGGQAIKKGRRWKAKATAIFDRDGEARILHHVGGAWHVSGEVRRGEKQ